MFTICSFNSPDLDTHKGSKPEWFRPPKFLEDVEKTVFHFQARLLGRRVAAVVSQSSFVSSDGANEGAWFAVAGLLHMHRGDA
jgi:hypothetical protein